MKKEITKISEKEMITLLLITNNIEISIKYPKRSTLQTRFEVINKLKEIMEKI